MPKRCSGGKPRARREATRARAWHRANPPASVAGSSAIPVTAATPSQSTPTCDPRRAGGRNQHTRTRCCSLECESRPTLPATRCGACSTTYRNAARWFRPPRNLAGNRGGAAWGGRWRTRWRWQEAARRWKSRRGACACACGLFAALLACLYSSTTISPALCLFFFWIPL